MTDFPGASLRQDFSAKYPGDHTKPNVVVLHTTEGSSWPGYAGGSEAPNLTVRKAPLRRKLKVRQHFPLDMSSRALVNAPGGVETNTLNAVQIELVGTCAKGGPGIFWPEAPDWAIRQLGEILATLNKLFPAIPLKDAAPRGWLPYPQSYGNNNGQRMTDREWLNCYGICGHQHVPENDHGDPGDLPIAAILAAAGAQDAPSEPSQQKSESRTATPKGPGLVRRAKGLLIRALRRAKWKPRKRRIRRGLHKLPRR